MVTRNSKGQFMSQPGYNGDRLKTLEGKIDNLVTQQNAMAVDIQAIKSSQILRQEMVADIEKRVSADVYTIDKTAINDRLDDLENKPKSTRDWLFALGSLGIGCLSLILAGTATFISLLVYLRVHP